MGHSDTNSGPVLKHDIGALMLGVSAGLVTFLGVFHLQNGAWSGAALVWVLPAVAMLIGLALPWSKTTPCVCPRPALWAVTALLASVTFLLTTTASHLSAYLNIPVDLLSYSESGFVNDILRISLHLPIYALPQDNQSTVYTPGSQILTYLIGRGLGSADSITLLRKVQFAYVLLSAVIATAACDALARGLLKGEEYTRRPVWLGIWFGVLMLVATEPRFNAYTQSLNSDGLALLISMIAFWLMVRHAWTPRAWTLPAMALLPAAGFLCKQNLLMWGPIFALYLFLSATISLRRQIVFVVATAALSVAAMGGCYLLYGDDFIFWTFTALSNKQVFLPRSMQHLLEAGAYLALGIAAGSVLVTRSTDRRAIALWCCWAVVLALQAYTSGFAWAMNHLGPAVMIAAAWSLVALVRLWPRAAVAAPLVPWVQRAHEAMAAVAIVGLLGGLGFAHDTRSPVPRDLDRYIADIEHEFAGLDPHRVLMDYGTWIYLREKVLMKDRGVAVAVHAGKNQPTINHPMLAETINRIEQKVYDKILVRELDTGGSAYDFQDRGSGVKDAILSNYREMRRIRPVNVNLWWPRHMLAEVQVFTRLPDTDTRPGEGVTHGRSVQGRP